MNILIAGGAKQSWEMRGKQLGAAIGAKVVGKPREQDVKWADVVVLIKGGGPLYAPLVHSLGKPLVWDALDFWVQPDHNEFDKPRSLALLAGELTVVKPTLTIGATERMAKACDGVFLPHHSWAGLVPTPPREYVKRVGYQGIPRYLGKWQDAIAGQCYKRGWEFVINPESLSECDILVAFRDGKWDGWMCRQWKSGVKAVNALAAGRPIIISESWGAIETPHEGTVVNGDDGLAEAFNDWSSYARRKRVAENAPVDSHAFTLEAVAARYRSILERVA